jgi:hypothetical protein
VGGSSLFSLGALLIARAVNNEIAVIVTGVAVAVTFVAGLRRR